ncbi:hypothetical protein KOW79_020902 [Hemibagrus wyckioides]|uniref:Uncharacterized protein n=1 Tax=Hemibagrus wyckioides TaxID=337641 RepID=A0A9D3N4R6_9TELE|nr:hypothetical protein KOW79_020902 [Hemibagrus wyckioides]
MARVKPGSFSVPAERRPHGTAVGTLPVVQIALLLSSCPGWGGAGWGVVGDAEQSVRGPLRPPSPAHPGLSASSLSCTVAMDTMATASLSFF